MRVVLLVSSEVCNAYSSGFPDGSVVACQCRRHKRRGFDPWARKIPWNRKWQPTQYSCLGNPMDRRVWWAIVHGITKSRTWLRIHTLRIHVCVCVLSHFIMNKEVSLTTRKLLFSLSGCLCMEFLTTHIHHWKLPLHNSIPPPDMHIWKLRLPTQATWNMLVCY